MGFHVPCVKGAGPKYPCFQVIAMLHFYKIIILLIYVQGILIEQWMSVSLEEIYL